jgi:hypothetical protein
VSQEVSQTEEQEKGIEKEKLGNSRHKLPWHAVHG